MESLLGNCPAAVATTLATALVLAATISPAFADAGVFAGNGQSLHQVSNEAVQLVSIDVRITLGRGPFLFDGTVPGMDQTQYSCTFVLRNLTEKPAEVQVGFPVDSMFAKENEPVSSSDSKDWVLSYGFIARDNQTTYHIDFVRRVPKPSPGEFSSLFVWKMRFGPKETRTLDVQYRIPMSMGLVTTRTEEPKDFSQADFATLAGLDLGMIETAGYITSTGSSWAGKVEKATFTVTTEPFERYLSQRGTEDSIPEDVTFEHVKRAESAFPVHHPWWFRKVTPGGWEKVQGGVQWRYKDYKPADPISVAYYLTQFPGLAEEVPAFVERFRKSLDNDSGHAGKLALVREILLATYGKEPENPTAKAFAAGQIWFAPKKDFSTSDLSDTQKAVLKELDARIAKGR
jgi:hypothetical protein